MSVNIPTHFVQQFATNIQLLLQQKGSKLRSTVMTGSHIGKQASPVDQIGAIEMQPVTGRFGAMGRVDAALDRRWVFPSDFDLPQLIDSYDKLRLLNDPTSSYVQNAVFAAGRKFDQLILAAINGTNQTGETGSTATTLPAAQKVAVNFGASANTGLTVAKLREAKRILMSADLDLDDPMNQLYCVVKAKQHDNLLAEAQVISTDFNDKPVLVEGKIMRFLGINFVHSELVETSTYDLVPVYAKSGVYLGLWNDISTDIDRRKDIQSLPWQAYVFMTAGATRLEEEKVVQVSCA
ncbi:MAG TPA: phage capsid protein [Agitococcus sp.]|nr:phage capsid protein [Agitococcus sp.]HNA70032.1 phage capsid protein [Nitrosomonas sp.]